MSFFADFLALLITRQGGDSSVVALYELFLELAWQKTSLPLSCLGMKTAQPFHADVKLSNGRSFRKECGY